MKKLLTTTGYLLIASIGYSQYVEDTTKTEEVKNYFISADYGYGTSSWNSNMTNTTLYDRYGIALKTGDIQFRTKTSVKYQNIAVMFPVSDIIVGLGVNFEEHRMDKIDIQKSITKIGEVGSGELLFDQKFRLDKFYALVEVPFYKNKKYGFTSSFQGRVGYFGYYGVDRENFFGDEQMANAYLASVAATASIKIVSKVYAYIHPKFEYNYFSNKSENGSRITHQIYSFAVASGIRIDVGAK